MNYALVATLVLSLLAGCKERQQAAIFQETSPGGLEYTRVYTSAAETVAVQIAWPTAWAWRAQANQAVPYIGAELILAGGAEGFAAGAAGETFADLQAEGNLSITPDYVFGTLVAPKQAFGQAVEIAAAHLAQPKLEQAWFERVRQGVSAQVAEGASQPAALGFDALRWAILGASPLRLALSGDVQKEAERATRAQVVEWHRQTLLRNGATVVIAGALEAQAAGAAVDALLSRLPIGALPPRPQLQADFAPRRILLHRPEVPSTTLLLLGALPPTRAGGEIEDILLLSALGGDDKSVLFEAMRTELRASYGFSAMADAYTRELRFLLLGGEVETAKLGAAEALVRARYAQFLQEPQLGDLAARKQPLAQSGQEVVKDPVATAFSALMALIDAQDPNIALTLPQLVAQATEPKLRARAAQAFPPAAGLIVLAVSPDAAALPDACVITTPEAAAACP